MVRLNGNIQIHMIIYSKFPTRLHYISNCLSTYHMCSRYWQTLIWVFWLAYDASRQLDVYLSLMAVSFFRLITLSKWSVHGGSYCSWYILFSIAASTIMGGTNSDNKRSHVLTEDQTLLENDSTTHRTRKGTINYYFL